MQENTKEKRLPTTGFYFPLEQVTLVPLHTYPLLPVLVTKSYLPQGLAVTLPLNLVYFEGLVDREPDYVRPSI